MSASAVPDVPFPCSYCPGLFLLSYCPCSYFLVFLLSWFGGGTVVHDCPHQKELMPSLAELFSKDQRDSTVCKMLALHEAVQESITSIPICFPKSLQE